MDWLALADCVFFFALNQIFLSSNFSAQCGACPRLPRPSLAAVLCGVGSQIVGYTGNQNVTPTGIFVGFLET